MQGRTECPEGYTRWPADLTCHPQGPCGPGQLVNPRSTGPACLTPEVVAKSPPGGEGGWGVALGGGWGLGGLGGLGGSNSLGDPGEEELPIWSRPTTRSLSPPRRPGGQRELLPTQEPIQFPEGTWSLPGESSQTLTAEEQACMELHKVWWPEDRSCHALLSQGPCGEGEWLVLNEDGSRVICAERLCPCDPAAPDLCEVEVEGSLSDPRWGRCRVASAAAQEGICQPGEQLLINPYGKGVCGCITSPPHVTWSDDGQCYPIQSQGPCLEGFVLSISKSSMEPVCIPAIPCPAGSKHDPGSCSEIAERNGQPMVEGSSGCHDLSNNRGSCHKLGTRGPCGEHEVLGLEPDNLEFMCVFSASKIKRVYDIIPSNSGVRGRVPRVLKMGNCRLDSNGKCRKSFFVRRSPRSLRNGISRSRGEQFYIKKRSAKDYLNFLRSFRRKRN